ncbi:MAG: DUF2142 domain-containing protein, partial [Actinomycetota bacterium]|nr:DUF2142 domain-containing protein [Actinomycetota bacterium]
MLGGNGQVVMPWRRRSPAMAATSARARLRTILRRGAMPAPLTLLLALVLVQGLAWSATTAPFNGPDEPAHIAYAQLVAETGHGPKKSDGTGSVSSEVARAEFELNLVPMIQHTEARPTWSALARVSKSLEHLPAAQRRNGTGPNAVAQNPPLYYFYEALAYRLSPNQSLLGRVFAMRAANVLLYMATVVLIWLAAGEVFARAWVRFLATAIVALNPRLASLAGNVNADTMLVTISTGFLYAGLALLRRGPTAWSVAGVGLLAGLAALTHGRGLFLIPCALVVFVLAWFRSRPGRAAILRQGVIAAACIVACLVVAYFWT